GLLATTLKQLSPLAAFSLSGVWLVPGLIAIGALIALAVDGAGRGAMSVLGAAVLGAVLYGAAVAAPGLRVAPVRIKLLNDGTTYGLVALLLCALFGMAGMMVVWVARIVLGRSDF